ncbi:MAG TPA: S9 family peptidase [Thermoanaerobaculia bacterium]|nr:S9 family peptidase [Thermoanaerobaculia bacterium]
MKRKRLAIFIVLLALPLAAQVASEPRKLAYRELTLDSIFDPKDRVAFSGAPQSGFVWIDDKAFTWPRTNEKGEVVEQVVMDAVSGKSHPLFDYERFDAAVRKIPGVDAAAAAKVARSKSWTFSPDGKRAAIAINDDLYLYAFEGGGAGTLTRLTSSPGEKKEAAFSPDGRSIAYVRGNNLFIADLADHRERQLTTDGNDDRLNGILDWVYQEEIYGRGKFRAFWWSPDSARIAFLQLDERPVRRFAVVDHIPTRQEVELTPYPKAGDPNPIARLFTIAASGGTATPVDTERYSGADHLIVNVDWTPDSTKVVYQVQNREQTWLDLNAWDLSKKTSTTLIHETTKAWVQAEENPVWLKDGSFLWLSERSGFKHIYRYGADGKLIRQVTDGRWEARTLQGIDPANDWIYFSGTERSAIGGDVYRIKPDGTGLHRLTETPGTHAALFNPSFTHFLDTWSDSETPPQVFLLRGDGTKVRTVDANEALTLRQFRFSKAEHVQVKTRDGFVMEAVLIKPPDFDPAKKYPVYEHTYSGPHAQQVVNAWGVRGNPGYLWHQFLASRGIVVWICDNRTASGKGAESAWPAYKNFGALELRDLEDGLAWLTSQPWADSSRVLLNGWSYGGFMTTYALTHSTKWSAGIAGGTVADWRDYDSIYTERYMLMPQNNPDGYRNSSPRWAAKDLHGDLLLLHGTIDDNVHMQNTIQLAYELEKDGKAFEMMLYPKSRHGVTDPVLVKHLRTEMWRFIEKELRPGAQ